MQHFFNIQSIFLLNKHQAAIISYENYPLANPSNNKNCISAKLPIFDIDQFCCPEINQNAFKFDVKQSKFVSA